MPSPREGIHSCFLKGNASRNINPCADEIPHHPFLEGYLLDFPAGMK